MVVLRKIEVVVEVHFVVDLSFFSFKAQSPFNTSKFLDLSTLLIHEDSAVQWINRVCFLLAEALSSVWIILTPSVWPSPTCPDSRTCHCHICGNRKINIKHQIVTEKLKCQKVKTDLIRNIDKVLSCRIPILQKIFIGVCHPPTTQVLS